MLLPHDLGVGVFNMTASNSYTLLPRRLHPAEVVVGRRPMQPGEEGVATSCSLMTFIIESYACTLVVVRQSVLVAGHVGPVAVELPVVGTTCTIKLTHVCI